MLSVPFLATQIGTHFRVVKVVIITDSGQRQKTALKAEKFTGTFFMFFFLFFFQNLEPQNAGLVDVKRI